MENQANPAVANLLPVLDNPNVRSFLDMISAAEGTTKHGYNTLFGGGKMESLADHPRQLFDFTETTGRPNKTTAAGRYQFLSNTWDEQAKKLGLPDFGERSQDLAAVNLLQERGILPDVLQGNWETAVKKSGPIWASLPSSPYPQPRQSNEFVMGRLNPNRMYAQTTTSDANPPMANSRNNPFEALNEEFRLGAPVQAQSQQKNPFEALNAEFALTPMQSQAAPIERTEPTKQPSTSDTIMNLLRNGGRQLGLTGRAAMEGVGSAIAAPTEPLRMATEAISQRLGGPAVASAETIAQRLANALGLPKPIEKSVMDSSGQGERFAFDVAKTGFSALPIVSGARAVAPFTGGRSQAVLNQLSANPAMQAISAAGAGAGGSVAREYGAPPEMELLASILGGVAAPTAAAPIGSGIKAATTAVASKVAPTRFGVQPEQVDELITSTLGRSGFDFAKVPDQVKTALRNDVANALRTGGTFDEDAMRRLIDIRMVQGATPTKGMITLDPRQVTLEQNLAKSGMNTTDPDLQQLGQIQNANNQALIRALNERGAGDVQSPYLLAAGEANVGKITAADAAKQAQTSALYKAAENTAGGTIPLDRSGLINNIDAALSAKNANAFLPPEIRNTLNSIAKGETIIEGVKYPVPFDVNALDNLMTTIATASRSTKDGNVRGALKIVRDAIEQTELKPIKADLGGGLVTAETGAMLRAADAQPKELLDALNKARASHRERMTWIESSKPIDATVNGMQPDQFVRKFVLSGDVADAAAVAKAGDPAATKSAILTHLKDKALGGQSDELGSFGAASYNKAIKDIGDKKLELFFNPDEIQELKRLGRVAGYMTTQPKGSAVNNSNSGALMLGVGIDALGAMGGLPFVGTAIGATAAVPLAKAGARKVFGGAVNKADQKEALNLANALANRVPGIGLGERLTSGALYGSLLQNPQLMQQLGQRLNQFRE
jgi:muramidase (phage lysozyme)